MLLKTSSFTMLIVALFLFSCKTTKPNLVEGVIQQINTAKSIILVGTIQVEVLTNNTGKEVTTNFYFKTNKNLYFIKLVDSRMSREQAIQLLKKEIEIEGDLLNGWWDLSVDNPANKQSRKGEYLIIHSFTPIINL